MNITGLIFLLVAHFLCGKGVLKLFGLMLRPVQIFCLSLMIGVPVVSLAPCFLQLMHFPLTSGSMYVSISLLTAILASPLVIRYKKPQLGKLILPQLYELPFIAIFFFLIVLSIWRCFYLPPQARDMLAGPELLAEFAVREKNMISSVFTIDLSTTNNQFKSPFITCLQIIYKLLVAPLGQLWLSILFLPFIIFIYTMLRDRIHPVLAGMLLLIYFAIPDLYAYTYLMLYDYSNMVFFFCGFYFLSQYLETKKANELAWTAFLFALATYIRTETLVLVVMTTPLLVFSFYKQKVPFKDIAIRSFIFVIGSVLAYFICSAVFVRSFIPLHFSVGEVMNRYLGDVSALFLRLKEISTLLIFSERAEIFYAYYIYIFCAILVIDVIWPRKYNHEARVALYGIVVVYVGLALLGYLLPNVDLLNTTKRGLFKGLILALWYMSNSGFLQKISDWMTAYENGIRDSRAGDAENKPVAQPVQPKMKGGTRKAK